MAAMPALFLGRGWQQLLKLNSFFGFFDLNLRAERRSEEHEQALRETRETWNLTKADNFPRRAVILLSGHARQKIQNETMNLMQLICNTHPSLAMSEHAEAQRCEHHP